MTIIMHASGYHLIERAIDDWGCSINEGRDGEENHGEENHPGYVHERFKFPLQEQVCTQSFPSIVPSFTTINYHRPIIDSS